MECKTCYVWVSKRIKTGCRDDTPGSGEGTVGVTNVWVQTHSDGLVRADQIVGIKAHRTPALTGKPANWLLDVVVPSTVSGAGTGAGITMLHRTLIQISQDPADAPVMLARLLAQLDVINAAGVIVAGRGQFGRRGAVPDARGEQSSRWSPEWCGSSSPRSRHHHRAATPAPSTCDS
jgi:hypothetical protein